MILPTSITPIQPNIPLPQPGTQESTPENTQLTPYEHESGLGLISDSIKGISIEKIGAICSIVFSIASGVYSEALPD